MSYRKALFPVSIFQNYIRENEYLKNKYLPKIQKNYNSGELNVPSGWNTGNVYTSFDNDDLNRTIFDHQLTDIYYDYIERFFDDDVRFEIKELWFNHYENGEYQEQHNHLNPDLFNSSFVHFACIHYLKFDPKVHSPAIFVDPIETLRYNSLEMKSNNYHDRYMPKVEEGSLLMFPNYLEHYVKETRPTPGNPRVTISFNIVVTKYGRNERY